MRKTYVLFVLLFVVVFAQASEPGSGGCSTCRDEYHHANVVTSCTAHPQGYVVDCSECVFPEQACTYNYTSYDWTCSYCASSSQHVGGFVGNQCVMGPGPATGIAPPNWYGPCPSCVVYGECSTEGRLNAPTETDDCETPAYVATMPVHSRDVFRAVP